MATAVKKPLETLNADERKRWEALRPAITNHKNIVWKLIEQLKEVKERRLHRENFDTFKDYVEEEVGLSSNRVYELIKYLDARENIRTEVKDDPDKYSSNALRELQYVPKDKIVDVMKLAQKKAGSERISTKHINEARLEIVGPVVSGRAVPEEKPVAASDQGNLGDFDKPDEAEQLLKQFKELVRQINDNLTCGRLIYDVANKSEREELRSLFGVINPPKEEPEQAVSGKLFGTTPEEQVQSLAKSLGHEKLITTAFIDMPVMKDQAKLLTELGKLNVNRIKNSGQYGDEFEQFWAVYPPRRKGAKKDAAKAWDKAIKELNVAKCPHPENEWGLFLIRRAKEFAATPLGQGQYCCGPAVWLNGGHWDDSPEMWQDGAAQANQASSPASPPRAYCEKVDEFINTPGKRHQPEE